MNKYICKQHQQHGLKVINDLASRSVTHTTIACFNNESLKHKVQTAMVTLEKCMEIKQIELITAYAARYTTEKTIYHSYFINALMYTLDR